MQAETFIYQVAVCVPLRQCFDYLGPLTGDVGVPIPRGSRVVVPFGRRRLIGIILGQQLHSSFPRESLKAIEHVCEDPLPFFTEPLCDFLMRAAQYYHHPIGEVIFSGIPSLFRSPKAYSPRSRPIVHKSPLPQQTPPVLNAEQAAGLKRILSAQGRFDTFLIQGITGSGKTEVYLQATQAILNAQQQILILVPEISLTPQTQQRFQDRFAQASCYHSGMTPAQRAKVWQGVRAGEIQLVIGTRSALFLPFTALGLIVIDEEHDASFKQQDGFRYSARDLGVLRAKMALCPIILGSATPAFETLYNAQIQKYQLITLRQRANNTTLPQVTLLDVRHKKLHHGLSAPLLQEIEKHCTAGGQVLLFINRRGFAPTFMCYGCHWVALCERCDARLTYHHHTALLICHHCLHQRKMPEICPGCHTADLHPVGQGTQRLEESLKALFPQFTQARIDGDVSRKKGMLENFLMQAENKNAQILIGTQILAKGHHFPHLSLVAILDADGGLFSADFRATERMAQLMIQVAGRAGRVHAAGHVMIQSCHPGHPLLQPILHQDYQALAQILLADRRLADLPPYSHLALLRVQAKDATLPESFLRGIAQSLKLVFSQPAPKNQTILGPVAAPMLKRQGYYRYQLLLQATDRKQLHQLLSHTTGLLEQSKIAKKLRWSLDVDPIEMF